jgi:DUF971 family protein
MACPDRLQVQGFRSLDLFATTAEVGANIAQINSLQISNIGPAALSPHLRGTGLILKVMPAPNPKSVKVNVTTGAGMDIEWDDGHRTHYGFQWLRDACPCATCTEERNNHGRKPGEPAKAASTLLPMYKEPARPKEVKPVGRYALNIAWNDGHASGIYSWDYLRELCQCDECRARVAAG